MSLVIKVLWKFISLIYFRVYLEVNVHKNPTCFSRWSVRSNKKVVGKRDTGQYTFQNVFNSFEANNNDGSTDINKATFSSEFVENLIDRYVLKDDVVLDCFSGTGTTMKVCEQKGIKFLGVESSEKQCQYTVDRIKNVQMQLF